MKIFKHTTTTGKQFDIICRYSSNRTGFKHHAELLLYNVTLAATSSQYYNRTWERYCYQTVILNTIDAAREREKDEEATQAKRETGRETLRSKETKNNYIQRLENSERLKELTELYTHFKTELHY